MKQFKKQKFLCQKYNRGINLERFSQMPQTNHEASFMEGFAHAEVVPPREENDDDDDVFCFAGSQAMGS